jgi:rare lipoprotein A
MVLLTSCSHVRRKDGPPNFYVDETKIPNAVPKAEPLAKYGNMKSYVVFGKRYYTLKSARHYEEIGVASWYGTQFHSHSTSSGERYDMLGMTAAHKTLPLPTYVEVTNLKNQRKIIVKVNDRGPFESNRIIDLSYVAAKKLGMLGHGTTLVKVRAIDPLNDNKPLRLANVNRHPHHKTPAFATWDSGEPTISHSKGVYLQIGAFRSLSNAEKLQRRVARLVVAPVRIVHDKLYTVKIGPFKNKFEADTTSQQLRGNGFKLRKLLV